MPTPSNMRDWRPRPTKVREPDGIIMLYQGWWNGGGWTRHAFRAPYSPRKYQRPPVRGGRWFVRRLPHQVRTDKTRPWYAWSNGKAKKWSRTFATQEEAYWWANFVAETYRAYDDFMAAQIIAQRTTYPGKGEDKEFLGE